MNTPISILLQHKGALVYTVPIAATISEAVGEMNNRKVGAVLVMDGAGIAGMFTERDVLTRVVVADINPKTTPVSQVMSRNVLTVPPEITVEEVMAIFTERRCRHLPVVSDGRLCGLISIGDISRHVSSVHRMEAEQLKQYIAGGYPS